MKDKAVIKVGFSRSPLTRRDQIQRAYPQGAFKWEVVKPQDSAAPAPYRNARIAIAGEDAMKARLVDDGAESLGGEFFLVEDWLMHTTWAAGQFAANAAQAANSAESGAATPLPTVAPASA